MAAQSISAWACRVVTMSLAVVRASKRQAVQPSQAVVLTWRDSVNCPLGLAERRIATTLSSAHLRLAARIPKRDCDPMGAFVRPPGT